MLRGGFSTRPQSESSLVVAPASERGDCPVLTLPPLVAHQLARSISTYGSAQSSNAELVSDAEQAIAILQNQVIWPGAARSEEIVHQLLAAVRIRQARGGSPPGVRKRTVPEIGLQVWPGAASDEDEDDRDDLRAQRPRSTSSNGTKQSLSVSPPSYPIPTFSRLPPPPKLGRSSSYSSSQPAYYPPPPP